LFSILLLEPDCETIAACLPASERHYVSTATIFKAYCAIRRPNLVDQRDRLQPLIEYFDLTVVPFDAAHLEIAQFAYIQFGRGSGHAAGLNMGDCFSYALSKALSLPLLFKGLDFTHTDLQSATQLSLAG
jgi:ribonuclease VapC